MRTANLAIVFTGIDGFAARAAKLSLEQSQQLLARHQALLTPVFHAFHGRVIKAVSDAFLVVFESPTLAVLAASAAQDELWKHNRSAKDDARLELRVAISAGEVGLEAGDVLGEPVTLAASLRDRAAPGDVWLTEAVQLVMNRAEVHAEAAGELGGMKLFKVTRSPDGGAAPYGGLGMSKTPPMPTGELGPALTASALQALSTNRAPLLKIAAGVVALAVLGTVLFALTRAPTVDPLQRAVDAVRTATAQERSNKIIQAQALISQELEASHRDFWYGKLQAAEDEDNAAQYFRSAVRAGYVPAEDELIGLLQHHKCAVRIGAIDAIRELRLLKARPALTTLSQQGGADDTERMLFFGCNSKAAAAEALANLGE